MFERRFYRRIPIWENRKRCNVLVRFRNAVIEYFMLEHEALRGAADINERAKLRYQINHDLGRVADFMRLAGVSDLVEYREAPMFGGRVHPGYSLLSNLFRLKDDQIAPVVLVDVLECAIGNLENDRRAAAWRTANPLYWLRLAIEGVARIPFALLGMAGFDRTKLEDSLAGKLVRLAVWLASGAAAVITLQNHFGS